MRRVATILGTAAVVMMATSVFAQAPSFAGVWTLDAEKTAAAAPAGGGGGRGGGRGGGGPMTIKQDAKTLSIVRTTQAGETTTTYNLDGSESKITMAGRGGAEPTTVVAKAKWDGAKLVITTTTPNGDQVVTWYMEGDYLVQERTGQNGAVKTYYKKGA
jgi:hypothetical protein